MKRIKEFDSIKVLLIISIICAHLSPITNLSTFNSNISWIYNALGVLGVPTFFFIAGYLFYNNKKNFKSFLLSKFKHIIIPWLFIGTLCYIMVFYFQNNLSLLGYLKFIIGKGSYLYYLSVLLMLYLILFKFKDNLFIILLTSILGIISLGWNVYVGINEYSYINLFNWIIYFNIGLLTNKYNQLPNLFNFCKKNRYLFLILFLEIFSYALYNQSTINYWTVLGILLIITFFFMSLGFVYNNNHNYKLLDFIGKNSLFFYLIHMPIAGIVVRLTQFSSILILLRPIITIVITYILIYICIKKLNNSQKNDRTEIKKILYVGTLVPAEYSLAIKNNSLAGNKLQVNFINEFRKHVELDIISFVCVPLTKEQQKKLDNYHHQNDKYYYKGDNFFKNLILFRKKVKELSKKYDAVMTFNVDYPWLNLPNLVHHKKSILILSDFSDTNSYKNIFMKCYAHLCKKDFRKYDLVIGLSKNHKKYLKPDQKFIYMPGGVKLDSYNNITPTNVSKKLKIMYSGYLGKVTGIDLLIEVFQLEEFKNVELIITGRGDLEEYVQNNTSKNIKYLGSLEEDKYLETLNSAHILINPRNMNLPENKNNFPSKIFDYLAVGKVLVSTKFSGYEEFKENFYFCDSNIESLKETILKAIKEYPKIYKKQFKLNTNKIKEYSWNIQVKKILKVLKKSID